MVTNWRIDTAKVGAEERLDGKYLLSTSDPDLSAEDVALGYKNLPEAERGFRDMKSTLDLRPVHHRIEPRIRAHVPLCWLALLLTRVAERRTGMTWRRIAIEKGSGPHRHAHRDCRHRHPDDTADGQRCRIVMSPRVRCCSTVSERGDRT